MNKNQLQTAFKHLPLGGLRYYDKIGSTNDVALNWAQEDAVRDFSLVVANEQSAGRGREGRDWSTPPDCALAFSLLLLPNTDETKNISLFTGLAALGITTALEKRYALHPQIKWTNDILLDGKKVAGILVESSWLGERLQAVVLGIGLNTHQAALPPAALLNFPATSLEAVLPAEQKIDRVALLADVVEAIDAWRPALGHDELVDAWEGRLAFRSEQVQVTRGDGNPLHGKLLGLNSDGSLRLDTHPSIHFGDVHLRPMQV